MAKPALEQNDKAFASLKSIKQGAALANEDDFNFLTREAESFVKAHKEECSSTPRLFKKDHWLDLTNSFIRELDAIPRLFSANRPNFDPKQHYSWPEDKTNITFLNFALLKYYSMKHCTQSSKKKKADEEDSEETSNQTPTKVAKKNQGSKSSERSSTQLSGQTPSVENVEVRQSEEMNAAPTSSNSFTPANLSNTAVDAVNNNDSNADGITAATRQNGCHEGAISLAREQSAITSESDGPFRASQEGHNAHEFNGYARNGTFLGHGPMQEIAHFTITFDVWINGYQCQTSGPISVHSGVTFAEFYGEVMMKIPNVSERIAIAKPRNCSFSLPGGQYINFYIDEVNKESLWRSLMNVAVGLVGKGGRFEGQHLAAGFYVPEDARSTVTMAEVEGPPMNGIAL